MNRLVALALRRPLGALALCLCLAGLGVVAWGGLPVVFSESRTYPVLTINTDLPQSGPLEVETQITRPVEQEMRGIDGLRKVLSVSRPGRSEVTLELHESTDVSTAAQQVRARLRRLRREFPHDARPPVISQYNPAQRPVAVLAVSGGESLGEAGEWARRELMPELKRLGAVADVELSGAPEPEVLVECDPYRLTSLDLTVRDVGLALSRGSESLPGGAMTSGSWRLPLRTAGRVATAKEIATIPVAAEPGGNLVTVEQVARVEPGFRDPRTITRLDGRPVATLAVYQAWGADLSRLWRQVQGLLDQRVKEGGPYQVEVVYSQAQKLSEALVRLGWVAALAALSAGVVVLIFLRSIITTLVVLAALPFSLLTALLLLWVMGQELDLLALSGLALAMGVLIDNAVVVSEAAHHHWQAGKGKAQGVLDGVSEVAGPIAFSTLTTVAAFLPLILVSDRVRLSLGGFFWGMSLSLVASLAAALFLVPVLLHLTRGLARTRPTGRPPRVYASLLNFSLKRPLAVILCGLVFLGLAALAGDRLPFSSGGVLATQGFTAVVVTPPGTPAEDTEQKTRGLETDLAKLEGVKRVHTRVWGNQGRIMVTFEQGFSGQAGMAQAETLLPQEGDTRYHLLPLGSGDGSTTLTLNLFGPDLKGLVAYYQKIRERLKDVPAISDHILKMGSPAPELELVLKHQLLGLYGLTARQVAEEVRTHLAGPVAIRLVRDDREIEVRVRALPQHGLGRASLNRIFIPVEGGRQIPLTELVEPRLTKAPAELFREDFRRVVRLTLVLKEADTLAAGQEVRQALAGVETNQDYFYNLGDELEQVVRTQREMLTGVILALILVYLIMVAASESLAGPLVVMCAAPFAAAGSIFGLFAMGMPITLPVYLGGVILAGLLVNTGLVMIDAMNSRRREGQSGHQAAREGALRRLRPVMISTVSTCAASLPLLLDTGPGSSAWAPLALTLAAGLVVSSLFALVLTPALFPLASWLDRLLSKGSPQPEPAPEADPQRTGPGPAADDGRADSISPG